MSGSNTTTLWLVRHAESATPHIFHGADSDVALSDHGHRQAAAAAEWFATHRPTRLISSAMLRARQTAAPIAARCGLDLRIEPLLHERRIGALSGTSFATPDGPWPETLRQWTSGRTSYATPGAESFDDLQSRLVPVFERITSELAGERIVLITHGIVCKVLLLSLLEGWGPARWHELGHANNLSVSELRRESGQNWQSVELLKVPAAVQRVDLARTDETSPRSHA